MLRPPSLQIYLFLKAYWTFLINCTLARFDVLDGRSRLKNYPFRGLVRCSSKRKDFKNLLNKFFSQRLRICPTSFFRKDSKNLLNKFFYIHSLYKYEGENHLEHPNNTSSVSRIRIQGHRPHNKNNWVSFWLFWNYKLEMHLWLPGWSKKSQLIFVLWKHPRVTDPVRSPPLWKNQPKTNPQW